MYADWSELPGKRGLQAQLTSMFERKEYRQYLQLVESLLIKSWADARGQARVFEDFIRPRTAVMKDSIPKQQLNRSTSPAASERDSYRDEFKGHKPTVGEEAFEEEEAQQKNDLRSLLIVLWRQLVVTANAFGVLCVERKEYGEAMLILRYAETLCGRDDLLPYKV